MMIQELLQKEFGLRADYVKNIVTLIDDGNTIPFIARYRKEMTGSCDDQVLRKLSDRLNYLRNMEKRRQEIGEAISAQDKMTDALALAIKDAQTLAGLEDIYRPYKQKRRTRASVARERGLAPLAELLLEQDRTTGTVQEIATPYIDSEKGVEDWEQAISGAQDIIAEEISDGAQTRAALKKLIGRYGSIVSKGEAGKSSVFEAYYDYEEPVSRIPGHRILAVNRGEKEGFLKVSVGVDDASACAKIFVAYVKGNSLTTPLVRQAAEDAWGRLLKPSLERETRSMLTETAHEAAIGLFALNLKPLLLLPPLHGKRVMAVDPAYRTGCKIAVVDETGMLLAHTVVYPTPPQSKVEEAKKVLTGLIVEHGVTAIAVGNGTATKEAEIFTADLIKQFDGKVSYMVVNEAGASVYSASELGAQEFPELDVSFRSAASIARRMQDPLAELVKIDPKSIGVGQYQHDMPPARLDEVLTGVVEDCVNSVGADLNTASASLLHYVSGLNATVAKNIVVYRNENGAFTSRTQLKKVPRLGGKAFEQCAGFLRIPGGKEPLDNTAVHPEAYPAAKKLLTMFGYKSADDAQDIVDRIEQTGEQEVATQCGIGVPTLQDIAEELKKPGRDLRDGLPKPVLRNDVMDIADLKEGMQFKGTVRNVIDFGVFVDIGVHQDGLVHISQITDRYLKHPSEAVCVGDIVDVRVLKVDREKGRISLTMKK